MNCAGISQAIGGDTIHKICRKLVMSGVIALYLHISHFLVRPNREKYNCRIKYTLTASQAWVHGCISKGIRLIVIAPDPVAMNSNPNQVEMGMSLMAQWLRHPWDMKCTFHDLDVMGISLPVYAVWYSVWYSKRVIELVFINEDLINCRHVCQSGNIMKAKKYSIPVTTHCFYLNLFYLQIRSFYVHFMIYISVQSKMLYLMVTTPFYVLYFIFIPSMCVCYIVPEKHPFQFIPCS